MVDTEIYELLNVAGLLNFKVFGCFSYLLVDITLHVETSTKFSFNFFCSFISRF